MAAVRDIYNALIPSTTVAWTETEQTLDERHLWFERQRGRGHPVLVAELEGRMPEVGTKFGRYLDLVLMQRILDSEPA